MNLQVGDMKGKRSFRDKRQLEMVYNPVGHGIGGQESDALHHASALAADQEGVNDYLFPERAVIAIF